MATGGGAGIAVDIELVRAYHGFNKDRTKELYLVLKYSSDGKKIILDEKGPMKKKNTKSYAEKNKHWEDLGNKLPDNEIKFVAIQCEYKNSKQTNQNDILLALWTPTNADIIKVMESAKHKDSIMKSLPGMNYIGEITSANDWNITMIVKNKLKGSLEG